MRTLLAAIAFIACANVAAETTFKGVPIGGSFDQAVQLLNVEGIDPAHCPKSAENGPYHWCYSFFHRPFDRNSNPRDWKHFTYGGAIAKGATIFGLGDRFVGVKLDLHPNWMDKLLVTMEDQFGKPSSVEEPPFQNRAGAKFNNKVVVWKRPDATITAWKYADSLEQARIEIKSPELLQYESAQEQQARVKGKSDL